MEVVIGLDTSCYTTSAAAMDNNGKLIADARIPLTVKPGAKGLAQSEMVFQHVRNLPAAMDQLRRQMRGETRILAVGASGRPRPVEGSYMPVFLVGLGCAKTLGAAINCPVIEISHQENHILAGMWSAGGDFKPEFLAVHASGGTTEILRVQRNQDTLTISLIGGTCDLHAGQFIDRIGVAMGLPFPAGPLLEKLAASGGGNAPVTPVSVEGTRISFSGPESHVMRWLGHSPDPADVAASVQLCIAESLQQALTSAIDLTGISDILLVGGVAANQFIRSHVADCLGRSRSAAIRWPAPVYSGDNAVGAAWRALAHKAV